MRILFVIQRDLVLSNILLWQESPNKNLAIAEYQKLGLT